MLVGLSSFELSEARPRRELRIQGSDVPGPLSTDSAIWCARAWQRRVWWVAVRQPRLGVDNKDMAMVNESHLYGILHISAE